MKRVYSLKKNRDFQFTYRVGKSVGNRLCTLVYVRDRRKPKKPRTQPLPVPNVRVGFSVSKKVGNSVRRNRAKRRLRAAFSPYLPYICEGHNLIFIARAPVVEEPFESLCRMMGALLDKAGLLRENAAGRPPAGGREHCV